MNGAPRYAREHENDVFYLFRVGAISLLFGAARNNSRTFYAGAVGIEKGTFVYGQWGFNLLQIESSKDILVSLELRLEKWIKE